MFQFVAEIFTMFVVEILFYGIGMKVIPLLSFGTARASDKIEEDEDGAEPRQCWREGGKIVFSHNISAFIGFLFLAVVIVAILRIF